MRAEAEYEMQWDIVPQMLDDQVSVLGKLCRSRTFCFWLMDFFCSRT